ncbi:N-6 DNA methylase [Siccirubricoccus phaeus]|uniref:N-6 DNA methylase n=1 Tax=Siccirubricoccus phaeus TaxID=2595053 RepID=UPI001A9C46D8|nr:N-6 DNA methylase [Siccirubricoccus phaeus]
MADSHPQDSTYPGYPQAATLEAGPASAYDANHHLIRGADAASWNEDMRANLKAEADQKAIFQEIRNFLAGRMLGATRDRALLEEVMKCLFARKQMLLLGALTARTPVDDLDLARKYREHFEPIPGVFNERDEILLDPSAIRYIDRQLARIDLFASDRDPVGDLYETFIGASIRGSEGQFFTPQNAGRWLVDAVAPSSGEKVIDPACGAGGFLVWAAQNTPKGLHLFGIEKDSYLAALARARTAILGVPAKVYGANALSFETDEKDLDPSDLLGEFDVVLTNPPFGKNIQSVSPTTQLGFALGRKWKRAKSGGYEQGSLAASKAPPQVLFMERIISLLRKGGRAGIVVPESMLGSRSYGHVVQFIRDHAAVRAVVGMPEALFKSSGKGGTHTKTCLLVIEKGARASSIFMAEAKWCGHDSRGRTIPKDDLPQIADDYQAFKEGKAGELGYKVDPKVLKANILSPRYHEPTAARATHHLTKTHELVSVQELVDEMAIEIRTGDEVGKLAYGTGPIPFVRTSDLSGWEIKIDPKHCVSEEVYERLKESQDVKRDDILMVRDGTYLIGTCAIVSEYDERIVYQSHIYKIRCLRPDRLSPYLLLAALSSEPVQRQIKAKTFTQDIIDSLGNRINELVLPLPRSREARQEIEEIVRKVVADRVEARELARRAKLLIVDPKFSPSAGSHSKSSSEADAFIAAAVASPSI